MIADRPTVVPEESPARVSISGPFRHLCPHVDEVDDGTVVIAWTCAGATVELHSLAAYLKGFEAERISHEHITDAIREDLSGLYGIADVTVSTSWQTAGLAVRVAVGQ